MTDGPFFPDDDKKDSEEPEASENEVGETDSGAEGEAKEEVEAEGGEPEVPIEPLILEDDDFGMPEVDPSETPFFDDDDDNGGLNWKPIAAVVAGLAIGGAVWFMISGESDKRPPRTIAASQSPIKERPEDPGGMDIPHQDTLVYNEVAGDAKPQPDTLGPAAEEPLDVPSDASSGDASSGMEKPIIQLPAEEEAAVPSIPAADDQLASLDSAADIPQAMGSDWVGGYLVQLGAFSSVEIATKVWRDLYAENRDVFSNPDANVLPKQSSSGKEIFALRAGPYSSNGDAGTVCKLLKTREVDCFVVKPE